MSGRKEKKSAPGGKRQAEEQRENLLQAVVCINFRSCEVFEFLTQKLQQVLADPFQNRFRPFTLENPRVRDCFLTFGLRALD